MLELQYHGLYKIISGGQTGADMAGLVAAAAAGIETGGTAPEGFMTEQGPNPGLAKYGLVPNGTLRTRTIQNIKDADATLILAVNPSSPGTVLTINTCIKLEKPYLIIDLKDVQANAINNLPVRESISILGSNAANWVEKNKVRVLNVAGNRKSKGSLIFELSLDVLYSMLNDLNLRKLLAVD